MWSKTLPKFLYTIIVAAGIVFCGINARAQTPQYIFPGSNPTYTGGANSWPLNAASSGSNMCQWLYLPADFAPTPPGSVFITTVYIKPSTTTTFTFTNLQVKLGNTTLSTLT